MIRATIGNTSYWNERIAKDIAWLSEASQLLTKPSKNPVYDPQFCWDRARDVVRLILRRYSRGDDVHDLGRDFPEFLRFWELSNKLSEEIVREHKLATCRDWEFSLASLNHYNFCFWAVGLALALEVPDEQWQRLLALVGCAGDDILMDRVIGSREKNRQCGTALLHPKPYRRLLKAIDSPGGRNADLLLDFVEKWYIELARKGNDQLWWHVYGDPNRNPLSMGSYFGRWCIEAVAAAKAFGIDDSRCLGHENYPGDLLRPNAPTTHPRRIDEEISGGLRSRLARLFR